MEVGGYLTAGNSESDADDAGTGEINTVATASNTASTAVVSLALQNTVILTNLFELCPPQLLPTIRLVCKQWRDLTLPMYRSNLPLTFSRFGNDTNEIIIVGVMKMWRGVVRENDFSFEDFVRDYVNKPETRIDRFPYRFIKLFTWHHYFQTPDSNPHFWNTVGSNVTTMELKRCFFGKVEDFRTIIYLTCPNLKTLRLVDCYYSDNHAERPSQYSEPAYGEHPQLKSLTFATIDYRGNLKLPISWLELFSHFPALTHFSFLLHNYLPDKLLFCLDYYEPIHDELFREMEILRNHDGHKLPFKNFTLRPLLDITPTDEKLQLFQKLDLPLKRAILRLHLTPDMEDQLVHDILKLLAGQLYKLVVIPKNPSIHWLVPMIWRFPYGGMDLGKLKSLQMYNVTCENLDFLMYTPNLEELRLSNVIHPEHGPPSVIVPTRMVSNSRLPNDFRLLKMTCLSCKYSLSEDDVSKLVRWVPHLEKLEMLLNDKQFGIVCQDWRGLKEMSVFGTDHGADSLTDRGITGQGRKNEAGEDEETHRPNITYLKDLHSFTSWGTTNLTDAAIYNGFLHLPLLKRLQIIGMGSTNVGSFLKVANFSEDARKALVDELGVVPSPVDQGFEPPNEIDDYYE